MNPSHARVLFWSLLVAEAAGSQTIMWHGLPIYRRLLLPGTEGASARDFVFTAIVVIVMQIAHWLAFRLRPRLQFRRNILLGYLLVFTGELSLFFVSALAVLVLFDRSAELDFVLWKVLILVAALFAIFSYKYQLSKLGDSLIEGQPDATTTWSSNASR